MDLELPAERFAVPLGGRAAQPISFSMHPAFGRTRDRGARPNTTTTAKPAASVTTRGLAQTAPTLDQPRGGDKKERTARSPRFCSPTLTRCKPSDASIEAEFGDPDSYDERHANHAWCRKFESAMRRETENLAAMRDFGLQDGETRTRTGDTTIFRQMLRIFEQPRKCLQIGWFSSAPRASRCRTISAWM
jgi:hypothetical protein